MDKVRCPYCGAEMVLRDWHDVFFGKGNFFECVCGAKSPIKASPDAARAAAMRRYQQENRGIDKCELKPGKVYWLETIGTGFRDGYVIFDGWEIAGFEENKHERDLYACFSGCGYDGCAEWTGVNSDQWRCWSRRPTDEELARRMIEK